MSKLTRNAPADHWLEMFPLGNGRLGAMIDGGLPTTRIQLNHEAAWSGSPRSEGSGRWASDRADVSDRIARARKALNEGDPQRAAQALQELQAPYAQAYLPVATLLLTRPDGALPNGDYSRSLDLTTGIHAVTSAAATSRSICSRSFDVLVTDAPGEVLVNLESPLNESARRIDEGVLTVVLALPSDVPPHFETRYPAASWSGDPLDSVQLVVGVKTVFDGERTSVYVAIATTFSAVLSRTEAELPALFDDVVRRIDAAEAAGVERVIQDESAQKSLLMKRSSFHFDQRATPPDSTDLVARFSAAIASGNALETDPGLASLLYDFGRYLAVSSSVGGQLPPTLQGIWNSGMQPPWSSAYTLNINAEMNLWSVFNTNLAECFEPWLAFVKRIAAAGEHTARRLYNSEGWVAHHNSDAWAYTSTVGDGHGDVRWSHWPLAPAWIARSLYDAVKFGAAGVSADDLWPIIRGAAEFCLDWQHRNDQGRWVTSPATSPENVYLSDGHEVALDISTAMDEQLLADLFTIVVALADRLQLSHDSVVAAAGERLAQMRPQPIIDGGLIREWDQPRLEEDPHHRHVSHLYGLFPGSGRWDDEGRAAASRTLDRRGDASTGWSLIWKLALRARLHQPAKVSDLLALVFRQAPVDDAFGEDGGLYPNLFAAHPPFQIDANLGFPGVLAECFLQSHDDIELLPAVPRELADGAAKGLVARPGISVDLEWRRGHLIEARFGSIPTPVRVRYRNGYVDLAAGEGRRLTTLDFR